MLFLSALTSRNPFSRRVTGLAGQRLRAADVEDQPESSEVLGIDFALFRQQQLRIAQLEDELSGLLQRRQYPSPTRTLQNHQAILDTTAQLFPHGKITITQESDPEIEDDEYFAILVETPGTVDEVVALHREWHDRLGNLAPETASFYRLLLDIND